MRTHAEGAGSASPPATPSSRARYARPRETPREQGGEDHQRDRQIEPERVAGREGDYVAGAEAGCPEGGQEPVDGLELRQLPRWLRNCALGELGGPRRVP